MRAMTLLLFVLQLLCVFATPVFATDVCGNVSGTWSLAESPYYVTCNITVPTGQTLVIDPGVQVLFEGRFKFTVNGTLQALGTEQDSIVFSRAFPTEESKWKGIRFVDASVNCRLEYCLLEYGKAEGSGVDPNGGAIMTLRASPVISHCTIARNEAVNAGGGVNCFDGTAVFNHCVIANNQALYAGGVNVWHSSAQFINCTIASNTSGNGNGGGVYIGGSTPVFNSTIIAFGAGSGVHFQDAAQNTQFSYCDIYGNSGANIVNPAYGPAGLGTLVQTNANGDSCDAYLNLCLDPEFMDAAGFNFALMGSSPCMDGGDPALPADPNGSTADIGARYSPCILSLTTPNGGETWAAFAHDTVRWTSSNITGLIRIELNRNYPIGVWEILVDNSENDGIEALYVTDPLSNHCRVRITSVLDNVSDLSAGDFSIEASEGYLVIVRLTNVNLPVFEWSTSVECPATSEEVFRFKNIGNGTLVFGAALDPASPDISRATSCGAEILLGPDDVSECSIIVTFDPSADGTVSDTLLVPSNAVNAINGYVRIPLRGTQVSTPPPPEIAIQSVGEDALLSWEPVLESINGCSINPSRYLVFYAPTLAGPYYYHGYTAANSYTHLGAVSFAAGMYYQVVTYMGPPSLVEDIPQEMLKDDVLRRLWY